jgi:CPA1 family monovalent cation:H+ antiporter
VDDSLGGLLLDAVIICVTVIVVRLIWVFPSAYLPRLPKRIREKDPFPSWQTVLIVGWTGMRGVVSLASALALPLTIESGAPFPQRDLIIFLAFSVILSTLVLQGLTLPLFIKVLKIKDDGGGEHEENKARLKAAYAGQRKLQELSNQDWVSPKMVQKFNHQYEARIKRYSGRYNGAVEDGIEEHFTNVQRLEEELLDAELEAILGLRDEGIINDEVLRKVRQDLDLEVVRLHQEN